MTQIYREHLDFMEEARKEFDENLRLETYSNEEGTLIALRYGMDRDCMQIHKLGEEVGFFANIMDVAPPLCVGDKNEEYRRAIEKAMDYIQDGRNKRANELYSCLYNVLVDDFS